MSSPVNSIPNPFQTPHPFSPSPPPVDVLHRDVAAPLKRGDRLGGAVGHDVAADAVHVEPIMGVGEWAGWVGLTGTF